jgi:hypothetical protein
MFALHPDEPEDVAFEEEEQIDCQERGQQSGLVGHDGAPTHRILHQPTGQGGPRRQCQGNSDPSRHGEWPDRDNGLISMISR